MPFFAQKYLTRYTHKTFFEEYTNFQAHYLSHCRDILLQSLVRKSYTPPAARIRVKYQTLGIIKEKRIGTKIVKFFSQIRKENFPMHAKNLCSPSPRMLSFFPWVGKGHKRHAIQFAFQTDFFFPQIWSNESVNFFSLRTLKWIVEKTVISHKFWVD